MSKQVRVTKVTIEYAFDGKLYSIDFPEPGKLGSVVFSRIDLDRLTRQQASDTSERVMSHRVDPKSLAAEDPNLQVMAVSQELGPTAAENGTAERSLWWHASSCSWFHPEDTDS